jgi:Protein of unknown function (DUF3024)
VSIEAQLPSSRGDAAVYRPFMPAIPEVDLQRIKRFCVEESPAEQADKVRVVHKVRGKSVTIFESRPPWDGRGAEWIDVPVAQLRYSPETTKWSLHWADRNSRWHPYEFIRPGSVTSLLEEVEKDTTCIFWG